MEGLFREMFYVVLEGSIFVNGFLVGKFRGFDVYKFSLSFGFISVGFVILRKLFIY